MPGRASKRRLGRPDTLDGIRIVAAHIRRIGGDFGLRFEHTTLGHSATERIRSSGSFYTHPLGPQGYTHKGQLVGSALGPGGQGQYLGVDRYTDQGRWGVFLRRVRFNDDFYFRSFSNRDSQDAEVSVGGSIYRFVGDLDVGAQVELSRRFNWNFVAGNDVTNLTLGLTLEWRGD